MKALGVNSVHIHFHKGYGLDFEKTSIEEATTWARRLHDNGIRVGVYIGCSFFTETFKHPDYARMITTQTPGWSSEQYFRQFVCFNSPYTFKYFKEVIRIAIERVKADILHFDNAFVSGYHDTLCHCSFCQEGFQKYLAEAIPEIAEIAGYDDPRLISPPPANRGAALSGVREMKEPGSIAWALYHAWSGCRNLKSYADYARSLKKDVMIFYNGANFCGITPFSRPDDEFAKMYLADITCIEDDNENPVGVTPDGMPVSRFRPYKVGNRTRTHVCYYMSERGRNNRLRLAEAAAFNYSSLGIVEASMQWNRLLTDKADVAYLNTLVKNERLFLERQPWHKAAVLRHNRSALLNPFPCALTPYVVEQMLFERHIPFAIVSERELAARSLGTEFHLLILPDAKCLDDRELDAIRSFVRRGGNLLTIGSSATATPFNKYKRDWGFEEIFRLGINPGEKYVDYEETAVSAFAAAARSRHTADIQCAAYGRGRAIYLPGLDFDLPDKTGLVRQSGFDWYYHPYWRKPRNADVFLRAVDELTGDHWQLRTDLPRRVGVETYRVRNGYRLYFVNFGNPDPVAASRLSVRWDAPSGRNVKAVWHVMGGDDQKLKVIEDDARTGQLTLPAFDLLGVLSLQP
ncbi:MAG: hypothetical protein PHR35_02440 [Kiritimatiellae bacterium]|nr:hypothetical protein [Kiritimatiellia bacterium]